MCKKLNLPKDERKTAEENILYDVVFTQDSTHAPNHTSDCEYRCRQRPQRRDSSVDIEFKLDGRRIGV
jgi:hypothetical protein